MTKCTSQQLLETGHKVTTMPSGHIKLTSPNRFYGYTESIGVRVAAVRRASLCSLLLRVINCELTMPSAWLTAPRLTLNKHYTSHEASDTFLSIPHLPDHTPIHAQMHAMDAAHADTAEKSGPGAKIGCGVIAPLHEPHHAPSEAASMIHH
ncbi:MAG: hypothetical protein OXC79_09105 [Candidatus Poribacteria bacterium]|nr:hypothetical protein [Candidatus Poribacteria bacterium]